MLLLAMFVSSVGSGPLNDQQVLFLSLGISLFIVAAAVTVLVVFICKRQRQKRKNEAQFEIYINPVSSPMKPTIEIDRI